MFISIIIVIFFSIVGGGLYYHYNYYNTDSTNAPANVSFEDRVKGALPEGSEIVLASEEYGKIFYLVPSKNMSSYGGKGKLYVYEKSTNSYYEVSNEELDYESVEDYIISPTRETIIINVQRGGAHGLVGLIRVQVSTNYIALIDDWTHSIKKEGNSYVIDKEICINEETATCSADMEFEITKLRVNSDGITRRYEK